jgi:hypothetical protein
VNKKAKTLSCAKISSSFEQNFRVLLSNRKQLERNSNLREPSRRFTSALEFKEALEAAVTITSKDQETVDKGKCLS